MSGSSSCAPQCGQSPCGVMASASATSPLPPGRAPTANALAPEAPADPATVAPSGFYHAQVTRVHDYGKMVRNGGGSGRRSRSFKSCPAVAGPPCTVAPASRRCSVRRPCRTFRVQRRVRITLSVQPSGSLTSRPAAPVCHDSASSANESRAAAPLGRQQTAKARRPLRTACRFFFLSNEATETAFPPPPMRFSSAEPAKTKPIGPSVTDTRRRTRRRRSFREGRDC